MLNIYICEDDNAQRIYFEQIIKKFLMMQEMDDYYKLSTSDPHSLLFELSQTKGTGLYFLDIDLRSDLDGIQLASQIRQYDPRGYIVFITTHDEMLPQTFAYKVEAMDFIVKDRPESIPDSIVNCIQAALKSEIAIHSQNMQTLSCKVDNMIFQINQNEIILIESDTVSHKLVIHTIHGIRRTSGSLKALQANLSPCFYRCHNSAVVNIKHILKYHPETRTLHLDNGETCSVSFRMSKSIQNALKNLNNH